MTKKRSCTDACEARASVSSDVLPSVSHEASDSEASAHERIRNVCAKILRNDTSRTTEFSVPNADGKKPAVLVERTQWDAEDNAELIREVPFQCLVLEIANDVGQGSSSPDGVRFQPASIVALQKASEDFVGNMFKDLEALHKDITIQDKDIQLVRRIRSERA